MTHIKFSISSLVAAVALWSVTARADLPEGYTAIDGIQSTDGGRQYILTDYVPSSSRIKIEATVTLAKYATQGIWCSRNGGTEKTLTLFAWSSGYFRLDRNNNISVYAGKGPSVNTKSVLKADYGALKFYVDGEDVGKTLGSGDFEPESKLGFFASHSKGTSFGNYALMSLHGAKIYNADGTLEREYVPVRCVANAGKATEYGLYETTEGKYFSTPGTTAFEPVEAAQVSWTESAALDAWILTVSGTYVMTAEDAAKLTANTHTNFIKRGTGLASGVPIQAYTGNITVEEGTFRLANQYACGADNTGWIRVCEGATLEVRGFTGRALTGKTIYTSGNGFNNKGAINGGSGWNTAANCRFILEGDSYYYAEDNEFGFYNFIDLAGHKLVGRQSATWHRWGFTGNTITNSADTAASFEFKGGMTRTEGGMTYFRGGPEGSSVHFYSDTSAWALGIAVEGFTSAWPMEIGPKFSYYASSISDHSIVDKGVLNGPLTFTGDVRLANNVTTGTNAIVNLKGTLTGNGVTDIGTGWVNYHTTANDYAGTVSVCRSNELASADFRAGFCLKRGAVYAASVTTLQDGDVDFEGGLVSEFKGPVTFTGANQSRMTGGNYLGARTALEKVRKEGTGELLLSAAVSITGRLEVAQGKVSLPPREELSIMGHAGLMGGVQNTVTWSVPEQGLGVYDTVYPRGTDPCGGWNTQGVKAPSTVSLRGYLWNRATTNVTWTFLANHNNLTWLWIDDSRIFSAQAPNRDESIANVTLSPGPHKFELVTTSNTGSDGGKYLRWASGKGSFCPSLAVDYQGRGVRDAVNNFNELADPGDGSVFTIDDKTMDQITDVFWLADIATAAFASSTEFDLGGNDYALGTLVGMPKVLNGGTLTVRDAWNLKLTEMDAESKLEMSGDLVFAEGAVLGLEGDLDNAPMEALQLLNAGTTIATVTGTLDVSNLMLSSELRAAGAVLTVSEDGKSLKLTVASSKYLRATATGIELGFSVKGGKPFKEVRIDIYRDGQLIGQRYLGDAYALKGSWTYEGEGYYVVKVTRTALASKDKGETETVTETNTFGEVMVGGTGSGIRYVSEDSETFTSIQAAVVSLTENNGGTGKIYVAPGTYRESGLTNGVELVSAIQVIGMTDDPSKVVVTKPAGVTNRIFLVAHADAAIRGLTIQGGAVPAMTGGTAYLYDNGGNVFIMSAGGTVENCIIKGGNSNANWPGAGGNVALYGGRLANCQVIGGWVQQNTITANWINCGGSVYARGDTKTPVIENCLITGCTAEKLAGGAPIGLFGSVKMLNCTVADNIGGYAGGVVVFNLNNKLPTIANCAFYNNAVRVADAADYQRVYVPLSTYRSTTGPTAEQVAACFTNCAAAVSINEACFVPEEFGFADAANGDYRLTKISSLIDAGVDTKDLGAVSAYGLYGNKRKVGGALDVGCSEYREPNLVRLPFRIIVR